MSRRDGIMTELAELKAKLAERTPKGSPADPDQLFDKLAWSDKDIDSAAEKPLDHDEWREIVSEMVERIVIDARRVTVAWREPYPELMKVTTYGLDPRPTRSHSMS